MKSPLVHSVLSFWGLLAFYFLTMGLLSRSLDGTLVQFKNLWPWMVAISLSFAAQVFLFLSLRKISTGATNGRMIAASTTTSTLSMVTCCAHHAADFLPLLGFSALSLFLVDYQKPILSLSLGINIFGALFMLKRFFKVRADLLTQL